MMKLTDIEGESKQFDESNIKKNFKRMKIKNLIFDNVIVNDPTSTELFIAKSAGDPITKQDIFIAFRGSRELKDWIMEFTKFDLVDNELADIIGIEDIVYGYISAKGTSYASPQIARTFALIGQKYKLERGILLPSVWWNFAYGRMKEAGQANSYDPVDTSNGINNKWGWGTISITNKN